MRPRWKPYGHEVDCAARYHETYTEYLKRLAESTGLEATDDAALRRMDRRRKKKGSNEERVNPHDPEARSRACRYLV